MLSIGLAGMVYLALLWLTPAHDPIGNRPLLFYSIALLIVGVQLMSLGVLAELVTAYNIKAVDTYSIAESIAPTRETIDIDSIDTTTVERKIESTADTISPETLTSKT
jgi:hypothetical protein